MSEDAKLQCALGVHRFDKKINDCLFLCSICERVSRETGWGGEIFEEYDEKGRVIRGWSTSGRWMKLDRDKKGRVIHRAYSMGDEEWITFFPGGGKIKRRRRARWPLYEEVRCYKGTRLQWIRRKWFK